MTAAHDDFGTDQHNPLASPRHFFTVTPSDSVPLPHKPKYLRINGAGALRITTDGGDDITMDVVAGEQIPCRPDFVMATGTSATGIVAFY